jgi:hypothetical protein
MIFPYGSLETECLYFLGVGAGGMANFDGEPFARILDAAGYRSTGTDEGDFHMLAGIEMCAMFHGVDQNLPESRYDLIFFSLGNARVSRAVQELNQAICSSKITSVRQAEPRGCPG